MKGELQSLCPQPRAPKSKEGPELTEDGAVGAGAPLAPGAQPEQLAAASAARPAGRSVVPSEG